MAAGIGRAPTNGENAIPQWIRNIWNWLGRVWGAILRAFALFFAVAFGRRLCPAKGRGSTRFCCKRRPLGRLSASMSRPEVRDET
jgi:hypothetical protein